MCKPLLGSPSLKKENLNISGLFSMELLDQQFAYQVLNDLHYRNIFSRRSNFEEGEFIQALDSEFCFKDALNSSVNIINSIII